jgi:hypothetical protein
MQFGFKNSRSMLIAERNSEINTDYGESSCPVSGAWSLFWPSFDFIFFVINFERLGLQTRHVTLP